jgi:ABC-type antimicrobial peptide transport system permease subunit
MRQALTFGVVGLVAGAGVTALLVRVLRSRLFGVGELDPPSLAAAGAGLLLLVVLASIGPALSAARTDPVRSLSTE